MYSNTIFLQIFAIAFLAKLISVSLYVLADSSNTPFIKSFNHYTSEGLVYTPTKRLRRTKHIDEWYLAFLNATNIIFDGADQMYQSIAYKIGKNKISSQVVTTILQDDCVSCHNGNTVTVVEKLITPTKTQEYDDAMILLHMDFENLQESDLYTNVNNQLGRFNYCVNTELYLLTENSIEDISVSFINTQCSVTFDLFSFSKEF